MANKITAKDAISIVQEYFQYATGNYGLRLNLEEIEKGESSHNWLVTMSYDDSPGYFSNTEPPRLKTKVFEVDGESGEVLSMKNPLY